MTTNQIPDTTNVTAQLPDGSILTAPARSVRKPFLRPELNGIKLFIGLPIYAQVPTFFMQCLMYYQSHEPVETVIHITQGDGVARSRNCLTAEFLRSDCTHLLFIDSDLIFSPDHVARVLSHRKDVVGGFYPKKQDGKLEWVINTLPAPMPPPDANGLQELKYIGTGFMCIARGVFEKLINAHPEIEFTEDYGRRTTAHDFWSMGVYRDRENGEGRYLSEDWYFCQRWLDLGGKIYGDTGVAIKHVGPIIFPLKSQEHEIFKPAEVPAAAKCAHGHSVECTNLCSQWSCQHEAANPDTVNNSGGSFAPAVPARGFSGFPARGENFDIEQRTG